MIIKMDNGVKMNISGDEINITLPNGKAIFINSDGEAEIVDDFKVSTANCDSFSVLKESVEELRL